LILIPTRELAFQIHEELLKFLRPLKVLFKIDFKSLLMIGGENFDYEKNEDKIC